MSCCSGSTQTRKMNIVISFRPQLDQQFQLTVPVQGVNGIWNGRANRVFNLGNAIHCGDRPPLGSQKIDFKFQLKCTETDKLTITGVLFIQFAKMINRLNLSPAIMDCPKGGPLCVTTWSSVFLNEYLGNATIVARGLKA